MLTAHAPCPPRIFRILSLLLVSALGCQGAAPLMAQLLAAPPKSMQIMILDGEGALNNIHDRTAREPIVQVQDENHRPIAGALVLFTIHGGTSGASATFANGLTTLSVTTDAEGKAIAHGLQLNQTSGSWQITVNATYGNLTAGTVINEMNVLPLAQATQAAQSSQVAGAVSHLPFQWILSKPVMLIAGATVAGTVSTIVAVKLVNSGTTINVGPTTVGAPSVAFQVRFGKH
jgi:hypothetical protein